MADTLLTVDGLCKAYRMPGTGVRHPKYLHAVSDVSFAIRRGETFGIVGESGCGKSTVARLLMGLEAPDAGAILLDGQRLDGLSEGQRRPLRPRMQMVFQDSGSSLNPRRRIGDILLEPMRFHRVVPRAQEQERLAELLEQVGLSPEVQNRYPHEFSGGQRQRICIARALSLNPELIILDEPTSALDVSVQAQILNLLRQLQQQLGLTYIFISHALSAVRYVSHRVGVMYMGRIVETGEVDAVFSAPVHPYTRALLDAAPIADVSLRDRPRLALLGEVGMEAPSGGCPFRARCPMAQPVCAQELPGLLPVGPEHHAACILGGERP